MILVLFFILFLSFTKRLVQDFVDKGLDVVFRFVAGDLFVQIALHIAPNRQLSERPGRPAAGRVPNEPMGEGRGKYNGRARGPGGIGQKKGVLAGI